MLCRPFCVCRRYCKTYGWRLKEHHNFLVRIATIEASCMGTDANRCDCNNNNGCVFDNKKLTPEFAQQEGKTARVENTDFPKMLQLANARNHEQGAPREEPRETEEVCTVIERGKGWFVLSHTKPSERHAGEICTVLWVSRCDPTRVCVLSRPGGTSGRPTRMPWRARACCTRMGASSYKSTKADSPDLKNKFCNCSQDRIGRWRWLSSCAVVVIILQQP